MISLKNKKCIIETIIDPSDIQIDYKFIQRKSFSLFDGIQLLIQNLNRGNIFLLRNTYNAIYIFDEIENTLESIHLIYYNNKRIKILSAEDFFQKCTCKVWEKDKNFLIDLRLLQYA